MAAAGDLKKTRPRIDKGTICGIAVAFTGIVGGLILEKGSLADLYQVTASLIVFGGTLGAVLIGTPLRDVVAAVRDLKLVFFEPSDNSGDILDTIVQYATKARKYGIVSLDDDVETIQDPFLKKAMMLAVDGVELTELNSVMQGEIEIEERRALRRAKVFESAGGYAPTIGIIGAVLGLIQVMKNLANIEDVGRGIAVAFVATLYGVGAANLLLIPAGTKIRNHAKRRAEVMELILQGVSGIVEGMNPKMILRKLEGLAQKQAFTGTAPASAAQPMLGERETLNT